jgi:rhodanese-related sulfurtransferase
MPITCDQLVEWQQHKEFTLLDVRLRDVKEKSPLSIAGAVWRDPEHIDAWKTALPTDRPVVVFCAHGRSVSQSVTRQLNEIGLTVDYLEGGLAAWQDQGHLTLSD